MNPLTEQPTHDPTISPGDLHHMTTSGWLPNTAFPALEELRERHEALIAQRNGKQAEVAALHAQYEAEDRARQAALDVAYVQATEPQLPELTSPEDRKAALAEAEAHALAAARAVVAFALEAREALRGPVPDDWSFTDAVNSGRVPPQGEGARVMASIAAQEAELTDAIAEAQRTLSEAAQKLREFVPLKTWVVRNANGHTGQIEPGYALPVPPAFTPMNKPANLDVPGWWPSIDGGTEDDSEDEASEEETGHVEMSDPWFLENDR